MAGVSAERISLEDMAALIESEQAEPLITAFDIGPTRYADRWWHLPDGQQTYQPVTAAQAELLDAAKIESDRADTVLAEVIALRGTGSPLQRAAAERGEEALAARMYDVPESGEDR